MTKLSTDTIHADNHLNRVSDVAPPINVSTTFRYDNGNLITALESDSGANSESLPVYSRTCHPNAERLEAILTKILGGPAVVYASGLSAYMAVLTYFKPKRLFQGDCYNGCRMAAQLFSRISGMELYPLADIEELCEPGDMIHIEDPINPYGEAVDLLERSSAIHKAGGLMLLDTTLAPPPLRNPWNFGVDIIMHSGTKYFGGHSDLLSGILSVKSEKIAHGLRDDRTILGTIPASLESFLLLRSLRTMDIRIKRQSNNCTKIVSYLMDHLSDYSSVLKSVHHASLQTEDFVAKQLPNGYGPVFSIVLKNKNQCPKLVKNLQLFQHATSLGGVESLVEWRALSDPHVEQALIRVSVGLEDVDDLIKDLAGILKRIHDKQL